MVLAPLLLAVVVQAPVPSEVAGRVVDAEGKPVEGAELLVDLASPVGPERPKLSRAKSDPQGRFRADLPPPEGPRQGSASVTVWAYRPGRGLGVLLSTRGALPPADTLVMKLGPGAGMTARVLGPDAKPAAGAKVTPRHFWSGPLPQGGSSGASVQAVSVPDELAERLSVTTDRDGRCRISGTPNFPGVGVQIEAPGYGRQQVAYASVADGQLTMKLLPVGRLSGRLVADDPKAVRGLKVNIMTRSETPGPGAATGRIDVTTDGDGRFEAAEAPAGRLLLNVEVPRGSGLSPRPPQGKSVVAGQLTEVVIPVKLPPKTRTVAGRVVDGEGRPVAGATVFQTGDSPARTSSETDAQGQFTLTGVASGSTFLFARATGFRFAGQVLKPGPEAGGVRVVMTREGEAPTAPMATLPPASTPGEERSLSGRLLDPFVERVLKEGDQGDKVQTLEVLARVDPARTLAVTEGPTLNEPFLKAMLRLRVGEGLLATALDEALPVFESVEDPGARAMGLLEAVDSLPASERARKLELLDRALPDARAAREPTGIRLILLGQVAERWLDLGLTEKGTKLLRETQADAGQLPDAAWPGYAKGAFAEELCQVDLDAALALTKGLSDPREFDRHHGNIAHELAARDPAAAERVLGMVRDRFQRDQYAVRVVYRMASADLPRARRLAGAVGDPGLRGYAQGMAALGLAEAKKSAEARTSLDEALSTLERAASPNGQPPSGLFDAAGVAASLVPVAEKISPELVAETFWRVLSMRGPRSPDARPYDPAVATDLKLAMALARYDRAVARALLEPCVGPDAPASVAGEQRGVAFAAAAVIDPAWAVKLVEALPDDPDVKFHATKNAARLAVAATLARRGEARWRYLQSRYLYVWVPDIEDIAAHP